MQRTATAKVPHVSTSSQHYAALSVPAVGLACAVPTLTALSCSVRAAISATRMMCRTPGGENTTQFIHDDLSMTDPLCCSWAEHWFCGAGWPGSTFQRSPMTSYCVEHASAPQTDPTPGGDGYAQYVSCNSDECEVTNNSTPRAPVCICWVHDDRENSYQPESEISKACNPKDDPAGFLGCAGVDDKFCKTAPQCNCTMGAPGHEATALPLSSAMASHVGRSDVFLPMSGAREPLLIGGFLSFPKLGACTETEALGESGCKWKRLPRSRSKQHKQSPQSPPQYISRLDYIPSLGY